MDAEWAQFAAMQQELRGDSDTDSAEREAHAAEGRWLALDYVRQRIGARHLTWDDYGWHRRDVFELVADHECRGATCTQTCAPPGRRFFDPLSGASHVASGDVYVCCTTGNVHVCSATQCTLEAESAQDHGTTLCPVSGRFKTAMLSYQESFRERESRMLDPRPPAYKRTTTRDGNTKRPRTAADRTRHLHRDVEAICTRLVTENPVRAVVEQRLAAADADMRLVVLRAIDRGHVGSVRAMTELLVAHYEPALFGTAMHMRALDARPLPVGTVEYLVRCVCELFQVVRDSGTGKDSNLHKLCMPLLFVLLHGLVGVVETNRATGRITDRRVTRDDGTAAPDATTAGLVTRQWVFVPAHPWLGRMLPANDDDVLPPVPGWEVEMANQMKRTRRIEQAFLYAMGNGTTDASKFCLASRVPELRVHI